MTGWDPTLYAGSAAHYALGRVPYPPELADRLAAELGLDGTGRLLDVGCGPGSLTLLLAPLFAAAVGLDPDPDMLAEAARRAGDLPVSWRRLTAEELPADLGTFRVVTFAQSFHWLDRPRVAAAVHGMLEPGGALVHVGATTHEGIGTERAGPHPRVPQDAVLELVRRWLGPVPRAGQGVLTKPPADEERVYRAAGFTGPRRIDLPERVMERTADQVVHAVLSLSGSAPHLFGERLPDFVEELRAVLRAASPDGRFTERMRDIRLDVWRP